MSRPLTRQRPMRGFTLIEIMLVVALVGLLAAIGFPTYHESVLKGKRAEGRAALADLLQQQERYMTQNGSYLFFQAATPMGVAPFTRYSGDKGPSAAAYTLTAEACDAALPATACVLVRATPTQAGSDLDVGDLMLGSNGVRTCSGPAAANNPRLCWP